jgi:hypothetical protein
MNLNLMFNWQITILSIFCAEIFSCICCICINKICIKSLDDDLPVYNLNHSDLESPDINPKDTSKSSSDSEVRRIAEFARIDNDKQVSSTQPLLQEKMAQN